MTGLPTFRYQSAFYAVISMREIALFGEDYAHRLVIGALVQRLAEEAGIVAHLDWRNAVRGHGRVVQEFDDYLRDLNRQGIRPDLIIVATDSNCSGLNARTRELERPNALVPIIMAIPDPHIERWLLLDGAAFHEAVGRGCDAPDQKCDRTRYKRLLIDAVYAAGITPSIGGIEFAEDIVRQMDIERAMQADRSLQRLVRQIRQTFREWQSPSS